MRVINIYSSFHFLVLIIVMIKIFRLANVNILINIIFNYNIRNFYKYHKSLD